MSLMELQNTPMLHDSVIDIKRYGPRQLALCPEEESGY